MQRSIRQPTRTDIGRIAKEMGSAIHGLLDMRVAVEPKAAELAALRRTDEAIDNLRWLADRSKMVPQSQLRQADSTLHIAIAHTARSDRLLDLVLDEQMRLHELLAYLSLAHGFGADQRQSAHQHGYIVDAIARGDTDLAYRQMHSHIQATNALLSTLLTLDLGAQRVHSQVRTEASVQS